MRIVDVIGEYIQSNTTYEGGKDLFLDFLPPTLKEGIVVRLVNSEVMGIGRLRRANIVIYYVTTNPISADEGVENLRKLLLKRRGLGADGWAILGLIQVENEGLYADMRKVVSLRFQVAYMED